MRRRRALRRPVARLIVAATARERLIFRKVTPRAAASSIKISGESVEVPDGRTCGFSLLSHLKTGHSTPVVSQSSEIAAFEWQPGVGDDTFLCKTV
jgi:hypothetical protein